MADGWSPRPARRVRRARYATGSRWHRAWRAQARHRGSGSWYLQEAVNDFAAARREEVRPFLAQRFDEHQAPAAFRALIGVVSDWRIDVRIVNFDEQALAEMLRPAFQEAVRDRKMTWNPAEGVRGSRLRPRKVTPWTDDEVRAFMDAARRDRLHAIWRLSLLALRPEEVAGLRWDSVDLTACTLTVARVQVIVAGTVLERETAKMPAGERTLPLDEGTVKALRELRKLQRKERMAAGEAYRAGSCGGYVAADEIGTGYSTQRLRGAFYRLVESAGLRRITFYHARHSALSYLLNSGQVPIAVVAAWAGHADGGATALKHYIRVRPDDLEAARDAIAALLGG